MTSTTTRISKRVPTEHGLAWVDSSLDAIDAIVVADRSLLASLAARESRTMQLAILRGAVQRMSSLNSVRVDDDERARGIVLYELVVALYRAKLPFDELDIVEVLRASRHRCGHGDDLAPPLELATLNALPPRENRAWREAVLHMALNDVVDLPKAWETRSANLVRALGAAHVVDFVSACWPPETGTEVLLDTASSHVLKNLVWLLWVLKRLAPEQQSRADALVASLAAQTMKPDNLAEKVALGAAVYLAECPPDIALGPLRGLAEWSRTLKRPGPKVPRIEDALAVLTRSIH